MSLVWSILRILLLWCIFHKKEAEVEIFIQNCSSSQSRLLKSIIIRKWLPILKKYHVEIPYECPIHPNRDIFKTKQDASIQYRVNQWYCKVCGKTFLTESQFDNHFDLRHLDLLTISEQSICLANYCDIMRCDTENFRVSKKGEKNKLITDVEVWTNTNNLKIYNNVKKPVKIKQKTASALNTKKELAYKKIYQPGTGKGDPYLLLKEKTNNENNQKNLKKECVPQHLKVLKKQCEEILKICLGGLLINMSVDDFILLHEEIYQTSCWYLRCDKYWDDSNSTHSNIPFGLVFVLVIVLSTGGCLCYYIIWILFENDPSTVQSGDFAKITHIDLKEIKGLSKNAMYLAPNEQNNSESQEVELNDHYIYISYPVDSSKKHFNSYYSRTTHL